MSVSRVPDVTRADAEVSGAAETWRLRGEIHATRGDLDRYIDELQRRRRELTDVKMQVRRHPALVVGLGAFVAAAVGGAVWKARRARQRKAISQIGRALSARGILGNLSGAFSAPRRERRSARILGHLADVGLPLGIAVAKALLRRFSTHPGQRPLESRTHTP